MGQQTRRVVVTFSTTTGAMAMEAAARAAGVPGRLIPVPRSVTAGCGLCWAAPPEDRAAVEALVIQRGLDVDGIYVILF